MRIVIDPESDLQEDKEGVSIHIKGYEGNPTCEPENNEHIYIEKYEGKIRILVWNGQEDPVHIEADLIPLKSSARDSGN